jgi:predicted acetyltransferase
MEVELREVAIEDRPVVEHLIQLYAYDFSEILDEDVADTGRFESISPGEWEDPSYRRFIVRVDGRLAGLAFVHRGSRLADDADVTDMDEFFVMRKYRRRGVGREVAHRLFEMFPGRWEVRELEPNVAAQAFWREVIGEYTGGRYEEEVIDDQRWHGPVQSFVSPGSAR